MNDRVVHGPPSGASAIALTYWCHHEVKIGYFLCSLLLDVVNASSDLISLHRVVTCKWGESIPTSRH